MEENPYEPPKVPNSKSERNHSSRFGKYEIGFVVVVALVIIWCLVDWAAVVFYGWQSR